MTNYKVAQTLYVQMRGLSQDIQALHQKYAALMAQSLTALRDLSQPPTEGQTMPNHESIAEPASMRTETGPTTPAPVDLSAKYTGVIGRTQGWFEVAGQMKIGEVNTERAAFYTGMQLEELTEKLTLIFGGDYAVVQKMNALAMQFKRGEHNDAMARALMVDPGEMLDGDLDLIWVSIGAATAQGADVAGGYTAVGLANWAKFPNGVATLDGNGKVVKPQGWKAADLKPYIHHTLRGV